VGSAKKLLAKMKNNPHDWRIEQLETVALRCGVMVRHGGGSHVVFTHAEWEELLTVPARRPIKPIYIRKFVALIECLEDVL